MLPRETDVGILSWRASVVNLQLFGMFTFTLSKTDYSRPKFNVALCLWSIFLQMFAACCAFITTRDVLFALLSPNIGTVVFVISFTFSLFSQNLASVIMLMNGKKLAAAITELSTKLNHNKPDERKRNSKKKLFIVLLFTTCTTAFATWYVVVIGLMDSVVSVVCIMIYVKCLLWSWFIVFDLSQKSFEFLSSHVVVCAENVVKSWTNWSSSQELSKNLTVTSVSQAELNNVILILHDMEGQIRQVWYSRRDLDVEQRS